MGQFGLADGTEKGKKIAPQRIRLEPPARLAQEGEFGGQRPPSDYAPSAATDTKLAFLKTAGQSTVIGAVAVNAALSQKQLKRLAIMAQDGIAMAVQPSHTPLDGDTIFALSTGDKHCESPVALAELGAAAARCVARALMRGVYEASK